jgi:hypothetical protein
MKTTIIKLNTFGFKEYVIAHLSSIVKDAFFKIIVSTMKYIFKAKSCAVGNSKTKNQLFLYVIRENKYHIQQYTKYFKDCF